MHSTLSYTGLLFFRDEYSKVKADLVQYGMLEAVLEWQGQVHLVKVQGFQLCISLVKRLEQRELLRPILQPQA